MSDIGISDARMRAQAGVASWEARRDGRQPDKYQRRYLHLYLPSEHYVAAVKAEAAARKMSVNSFMRAMIRGYFASALHGR